MTVRTNKAERQRLSYEQTQQAVTALHCTGCPYKFCVGSRALMSYEEQTRGYRDGDEFNRRFKNG
jgi:hypothetical protein